MAVVPTMFLEPVGVLEARHFDQDAVRALALDIGLGGAEAVDAAVEHLDRLLDGAGDLVVDGRVGEGQLEQAVAGVGDVEAGAAGAGGDLHQAVKLGHDPRPRVGVGDADLDAARIHADAAGNRDLFLAQLRGAGRRAGCRPWCGPRRRDRPHRADARRPADRGRARSNSAAATTAGSAPVSRDCPARSCWECRSGSRSGSRRGWKTIFQGA